MDVDIPYKIEYGDWMYIPFSKDTLQKISLIAFAQAILAMMGDTRKVIGFYPTELIIPTFRHKFMDGVLILWWNVNGYRISDGKSDGEISSSLRPICSKSEGY